LLTIINDPLQLRLHNLVIDYEHAYTLGIDRCMTTEGAKHRRGDNVKQQGYIRPV